MGKYKCQWEGEGGTYTADFNIYQARKGCICLMIGGNVTVLSLTQIQELGIDIYDLFDFDFTDYKQYYGL